MSAPAQFSLSLDTVRFIRLVLCERAEVRGPEVEALYTLKRNLDRVLAQVGARQAEVDELRRELEEEAAFEAELRSLGLGEDVPELAEQLPAPVPELAEQLPAPVPELAEQLPAPEENAPAA